MFTIQKMRLFEIEIFKEVNFSVRIHFLRISLEYIFKSYFEAIRLIQYLKRRKEIGVPFPQIQSVFLTRTLYDLDVVYLASLLPKDIIHQMCLI